MSDFKTILQQNKIIVVGVAVACIAAGALAGLVFRAPADVVVESTGTVNETVELPVAADAPVVADAQSATEAAPQESVMSQDAAQDAVQGPVFAAAPVVDETIRMEIQTGEWPKKMILASPTVTANQNLPVEYTCYRKGKSPPLSWKNPPNGTQSFVVMLDNPNDPRGGSKTHWMAYNIPANQGALPADLSAKGQNPNGLSEGKNDFGRDGYAGPCIPKGAHTFIYRIYALDVNPMLPPGVSRNALVSVMNGHILDMAELPAVHQYR